MNRIFTLLLAGVCISAPAQAEDSAKWLFNTVWPPGHFTELDFERRMLNDAKIPHNRQWDADPWTPESWISQRDDAVKLVEGFYKAEILEDQVMHDGIPYLYVGPKFYHLSGEDKVRLAETVDKVYGITAAGENEVFVLYDDREDKSIGLYTVNGLQLQ